MNLDFVCYEIVGLGTIFDGAVLFYKTITGSVFCEVLHLETIVENMTAVIKMWDFSEGILSPSAEKKFGKPAGASYASRYDVF